MAPRSVKSNGWSKYQLMVLEKLKDNTDETKAIKIEVEGIRTSDIPEIKIEIAKLKIKAGIWGLMGGAIPVSIALLLEWLKK